MNNRANIFDGLVTNERTYTELFRNMCRYRFFRDSFARFVSEGSGQDALSTRSALVGFSFQFAQVETQYYAEESGTYPDVVIDTGDLRLVIEMKTNTWTGFQDSQPNTYLADLERYDADHKGLVVLIPKHHGHEPEIIERINAYRNDSGDRPFILLLYWEEFIHQLDDAGAKELNSTFRDYIDLSNEWFVNGRIAISSTQLATLDKPMAEALFALRALVEVVHARFRRAEGITLSRIKLTGYDFGFYFSDGEKTIGYWGFANFGWIYGPSPIMLGVHESYLENLDASGLIRGEPEDGLYYWGVSRSMLSGSSVVKEITHLVSTTFQIEPDGVGETESDVRFRDTALDTVFSVGEGSSVFQDLIRVLEQINVAVAGTVPNVVVKTEASRWEHSLYVWINGEPVAGIGVFFGDWKAHGLPLWVGVPDARQQYLLKPTQQGWTGGAEDGYREPEDGGENAWVYRPVRLDHLVDGDNVVEYALRILESLGLAVSVRG